MSTMAESSTDLEAAKLLLSVSPLFKPTVSMSLPIVAAVNAGRQGLPLFHRPDGMINLNAGTATRDRSWSMHSLETLVDVAMRSQSFSIGPSATDMKATTSKGVGNLVRGRSLLEQQQKQQIYKGLAQQSTHAEDDDGDISRDGDDDDEDEHASLERRIAALSQATRFCGTSLGNSSSTNNNFVVGGENTVRFPSVLPSRYGQMYFKNGRVGIYAPSHRRALVVKHAQKRARRVWSKKVRYGCRKSLANQRIRIKGRFVKTTTKLRAENESRPEQV